MTLPRFFAPDLDPDRPDATLPADESHHLVRVLRLTGGDEVAIFDGRGHEFRARVARADRNAATVKIVGALPASPEPAVTTILVQAVLKGDKMDGVVRDATMAGVTRIVPVVTERTLMRLSTRAREHALDRWQRVSISSAKQCRRSHLPHIDPPQPFADWLQAAFDGRRLLLTEPVAGVDQVPSIREALAGPKPAAVACVVGPEGGWASGEKEAAVAAGCAIVSLGPMTLRADAAGLVAVSLVSFAFDGR